MYWFPFSWFCVYQPKKNTLCCLFPFQQQKAVLGVLPIIYSLYVHRSVSHTSPAGNCFVLEDTETPAAGGVFPVNLQSHIKEVNEQLCLTSGQVANLACENELSERRLQITSRMPLPPSKISSGWGSLLERTCLYQSLQSSLRTRRVKTAIMGLGTSAISRALAAECSAQPAETVQTPCQPLSEGDNPPGNVSGSSWTGTGLLAPADRPWAQWSLRVRQLQTGAC